MHPCAASPCKKQIEDKLLMCMRHWRMVPRDIQREIWQHYVQGQTWETATTQYRSAYLKAVDAVRAVEGRRPAVRQ